MMLLGVFGTIEVRAIEGWAMRQMTEYGVNPGWGLLLSDAGISPVNVLRRAGLPRDLFNSGPRTITVEQCFAMWEAIEAESGDPLLPISVGRVISLESFDVPLFAATCSPNLSVAARRLGEHKKLIGPMTLSVTESETETVLEFIWPPDVTPPRSLSMTEVVFWVALARLATRAPIRPVRVTSPDPPDDAEAYGEYFGVRVRKGGAYTVAFSAQDAARPFLTVNDRMWEFFEPELRRRLSELEAGTTVAERVRASLLELLPAGNGSMEGVARDLAMSTRTLQRRLKAEKTTFQAILDATRESLARHYLSESELSTGEISFLLGYEDPRSFYRAFRSWTGQTPQVVRAEAC
jgi:AraC-like DNA-binding protein